MESIPASRHFTGMQTEIIWADTRLTTEWGKGLYIDRMQ